VPPRGGRLLELAARGVEVVPIVETARVVKTPLELAIHHDNARLVDDTVVAFLEHLTPGKTENQLWARLGEQAFSHGAHYPDARSLCSGPRPIRGCRGTDGVVENGDLVAFDTDLVDLTGISRTYLCGDRRATRDQREPVVKVGDHHAGVLEPGMVLTHRR
jgi:Xaa-Pro aminopeptidase